MCLMKKLLMFIVFTAAVSAHSQDSLKVLHYNLLNYGNYTTYCTTGNNNHENKDGWIKTIMDYELPDILTVNEISSYEFYHNRILNSVMNTGGRTWYARGTISNVAGSDIVNMLYYNSEKLVLKSHEVVQYFVRDIDLYTLYCQTPDLSRGDTVFLHCLVAHLKAGSYADDEDDRADMTYNAINYLINNKEPGNFLFMGDLNTYSSSEICYQNLTNLSAQGFRFFDPVSKSGNWSGNSSFASWHTQSVTTTTAGCQSSGGMDDRFDHILASAQLINGTMGLKYINNSYHAVGQDGKHFNKSITDFPANTSVPANVLNALYNNSDHLPVRLDLRLISGGPGSIHDPSVFRNAGITIYEPGLACLQVTSSEETDADLSVISITGQVIRSESHRLVRGRNEIRFDISRLNKGIYILRLMDSRGQKASLKMVK